MSDPVPFDYQDWAAAYPEFSNVTETQITMRILPLARQVIAGFIGCVTDPQEQINFLWLMVAHLCQLNFGTAASPATGLVGRVASATEGSVSVQLDFQATQNQAWYVQTSYGALFWQLARPYWLGGFSFPAPAPTPFPYR